MMFNNGCLSRTSVELQLLLRHFFLFECETPEMWVYPMIFYHPQDHYGIGKTNVEKVQNSLPHQFINGFYSVKLLIARCFYNFLWVKTIP